MFDIDGTLTETMTVDSECYVRSLLEVFGFTGIDTDWSRYTHTSDSGILQELFASRTGRAPSEADVSRFRQHFIGLLTAASSQAPFAAVTGAERLLSRLAFSDSHRVCLATGAWRESARLKMTSAGLCFDDHPSATAEDAPDRESIMRLSMQRALDRRGAPFQQIVYVGDGVWDARACRSLGLPFIGIGSSVRAERLALEGAVRVFPDLSDADLFLECLNDIKTNESPVLKYDNQIPRS
ncbi:MAG: HAD family hydrolase [Opitutaceae bacterium]|nr:HAD family hydrolase [Verrucomicrobiales bacterium]